MDFSIPIGRVANTDVNHGDIMYTTYIYTHTHTYICKHILGDDDRERRSRVSATWHREASNTDHNPWAASRS